MDADIQPGQLKFLKLIIMALVMNFISSNDKNEINTWVTSLVSRVMTALVHAPVIRH